VRFDSSECMNVGELVFWSMSLLIVVLIATGLVI
jgi:hypothetical protein